MSWKRALLFCLLFLVLLSGLTAGIHTLTQNNNLGTDFYIFWQAGRAVFLEHATPYSDEIALRSQMAIFKRLSNPDEDQLAFVYPPFALVPLLPVIGLSFDWAQAAWIAFLLLGLVTSLWMAFPLAPRFAGISFLAFYPVFFGLVLGNFAILIAALITLLVGIYLPKSKPAYTWQVAAGLAAAWLAVKPQLTWPYVIFLLLYAIRYRQWVFFGSMAAGFLSLVGLSFILVPGWPVEWLARITKYTAYNQSWPIATYLLKEIMPLSAASWLAAAIGVMGGFLSVWWIACWWRGQISWLALLAWLGLIGYLFHPRGASYEHITFLLPMVYWICTAPRPVPRVYPAWWIASLVVSWAAFFISVGLPAMQSATEWPVLFHAAWIVWLLIPQNLESPRQV